MYSVRGTKMRFLPPDSQPSPLTQDHFKHALTYLLYNGSDEYDVQVVSVNPADTHIMVEFFAMGHNSKKIMNTTEAYYKLTEKGQNFHYTSYHILKVDMKGVSSSIPT